MLKKDEEKNKKKRMTNSKNNKMKKDDSNITKNKHRKKKETAQKAKQAEKNPFSVFTEKDGEEVMDDDSVVFTEPSSSDDLLKGTHFHDYH